jgi:hypothetical protein
MGGPVGLGCGLRGTGLPDFGSIEGPEKGGLERHFGAQQSCPPSPGGQPTQWKVQSDGSDEC